MEIKMPMEFERGKERLTESKSRKKHTCVNCNNQTFLLLQCSDFPFFEALCSKCGSIYLR